MNPKRWIAPLTPAIAVALGFVGATSALGQAASEPRPATTPPADEVIQLSPFQVDASKDKGYFAENTLAGSRMKTNIADLAASISVITKQQLEDTASVDINDVFRYEINTEGSSTYTPTGQGNMSLRNDGVMDVVAGATSGGTVGSRTNAGANRVRGLGQPSTAINFYPSISAIPMDAYNVESLEISRGPNSMLFGMGSPAGIVNVSTAKANLTRTTNVVQLRFDHLGSHRGTFSFNRPIIEDKLAIYGAVLYDKRQFERKPSYDTTRRQYGAITFKPFPKTVLRANVEGFNNSNRRPNSMTPRDFVTPWREAGSPIYDAVAGRVNFANGTQSGPLIINSGHPRANEVRQWILSRPNYNPALRGSGSNTTFTQYNGVSIFDTAAYTNPNSILFVPGINFANASRPLQQIQGGQLQNWVNIPYGVRRATSYGFNTAGDPVSFITPTQNEVLANPVWAEQFNRAYTQSTSLPFADITLRNNRIPGVTDKAIYNWEEINLNQMNFGHDRATSYNVELEQEITKEVFLNAGWFRQDWDSFTNYTVAQLNASTLFVDTNKFLPDGTPNPYVGLPHLLDFDPDRFINSAIEDHFRVMLAYTPDFTRKNNWMKWLGRHQILGLWSRDESMQSAYRQRLNFLGASSAEANYRYLPNPSARANGQPSGWNYQGGGSIQRFFYLANPGDAPGVVTRSSGEFDALQYTAPLDYYSFPSSSWKTDDVTVGFNTFDAPGRNQRTLQSISAGMTSHFWNDRIVTTLGIRNDKFKARVTGTGLLRDANGAVRAPAMTNPEKWENGIFRDGAVMNRWNNWAYLEGNTSTKGVVVRPFKNWDSIESRANDNVFWQFIRDFGVSYNESDNFNAPEQADVDAFGTPLPKPTGKGKDYGFQFSVLDNKLFARVTWFEASNQNERTNPGTSISRLVNNVDETLYRNWARYIAMINRGRDPRLTTFDQNISSIEEQEIRDATAKIWGMPYTYYGDLGGRIWATRNAESEGMEAQLNFNPSRNWTIRGTFGKQETRYSDVLREFDAWSAVRRPVWEAAKAATYLLPEYQHLLTHTTAGGRQVDLTNFWTGYGFRSEVQLGEVNGNESVRQYYFNVVEPQAALARDLNGQVAPGQRKYRWSLLTNYQFDEGRLRGWSVGGSQRWEDKAVIGYYGKASGVDRTNPGLLDLSDITRPIYDSANSYTDLWMSYTRRILKDRVRMKVQLNIENVFESGRLQAVSVNFDGSPYAFRIVDPRRFLLTTTFDF